MPFGNIYYSDILFVIFNSFSIDFYTDSLFAFAFIFLQLENLSLSRIYAFWIELEFGGINKDIILVFMIFSCHIYSNYLFILKYYNLFERS